MPPPVIATVPWVPGVMAVIVSVCPRSLAGPGASFASTGSVVTSGTHSPSLKRNVALGYVPITLANVGQTLAVETRGRPVPARVVGLPFVAHHSRPRAKM